MRRDADWPHLTGSTTSEVVAAPLLIGALLLLLVTLPVTLPLAAFLERRDRQRLLAVSIRTRCDCCGSLLGADALDASDAAYRTKLADAHLRHPGMRIHVARRSHARCAACSADYVWNPKPAALHLLPELRAL